MVGGVPGNFISIIQARLTSKRLPNKLLESVGQMSQIDWVLNYTKQLNTSKNIFAIPNNVENDILDNYLLENQQFVHRSSEENVLQRYREVLENNRCKYFIRITADDPFKCPDIINKMIDIVERKNLISLSNTYKKTFPDGLDVEIFEKDYFLNKTKNFKRSDYLEHVTLGLYNKNIKDINNYEMDRNLNSLRLTLDNEKDLTMLRKIGNNLNLNYTFEHLIDTINKIFNLNYKIGKYYVSKN